MSKATQQALAFISEAQKYNFKIVVKSDSVIMIEKRFLPEDKEAFTECDMFGESVLFLAPLKGGSVWGTDGGSVGGYSALKNGHYMLNESGEGKRFITALRKELDARNNN